MRVLTGVVVFAALAACMGADISLEELYKRAEEQSNPPPPPPSMDREHQKWSTANLLGWNSSPEETGDIFQDMVKRHANDEHGLFGDDEPEHAHKKAPKPAKVVKVAPVAKKVAKKAAVVHAAKVKAVKVALVKKARAKKVQIPSMRLSFHESSADAVVPEGEHADMLESNFFDSHKKHRAPKKASSDSSDLLSGMPTLAGVAPSKPTVNSLGALAGNLLNQVDKKADEARAAKNVAMKKKLAKKVKVVKKAHKEQDPFKMSLSEAPVTATKPVSEKKLPPLGAFLGGLGGDDDDDDDF